MLEMHSIIKNVIFRRRKAVWVDKTPVVYDFERDYCTFSLSEITALSLVFIVFIDYF